MARSRPQEDLEKMLKIENAWETLAPDSAFGGMKLPDFKTLIQPSLDARARLDEIKAEEDKAAMERDHNDDKVGAKIETIVAGVVADPNFGNDSALYEAMGYIPKSKRKSGLTRKKKPPAE